MPVLNDTAGSAGTMITAYSRQHGRVGAAIAALRAALEAFDPYTAEHSDDTEELAVRVAARLGASPREIDHVARVAALHDIGKIGIPTAILNKPGPLTGDEFATIRQHPVIGQRILLAVPELADVARAVRHEHERWGGGGYPDGIAGAKIPLASRIVFVCDSWHAMTSDRPYRRPLSRPAAIAELIRCSGTQFDPTVTQALLDVLADAA